MFFKNPSTETSLEKPKKMKMNELRKVACILNMDGIFVRFLLRSSSSQQFKNLLTSLLHWGLNLLTSLLHCCLIKCCIEVYLLFNPYNTFNPYLTFVYHFKCIIITNIYIYISCFQNFMRFILMMIIIPKDLTIDADY